MLFYSIRLELVSYTCNPTDIFNIYCLPPGDLPFVCEMQKSNSNMLSTFIISYVRLIEWILKRYSIQLLWIITAWKEIIWHFDNKGDLELNRFSSSLRSMMICVVVFLSFIQWLPVNASCVWWVLYEKLIHLIQSLIHF